MDTNFLVTTVIAIIVLLILSYPFVLSLLSSEPEIDTVFSLFSFFVLLAVISIIMCLIGLKTKSNIGLYMALITAIIIIVFWVLLFLGLAGVIG